jgi:hypothetical protein
VLVAKIFNLRHNSLLSAIAGLENSSPDDLFLSLGYPILKPPRLRGSMAVVLRPEFVHANINRLQWWSPVDFGGLSLGYFGSPPVGVSCVQIGRLSGRALLQFLADVRKLPYEERKALADHSRSPTVVELLAKYLGDEIIPLLMSSNDPHRFASELCFSFKGPLALHDLLAFYYPSTYRWIPIIRTIKRRFRNHVYSYQPSGGIEQIANELVRFDRYI